MIFMKLRYEPEMPKQVLLELLAKGELFPNHHLMIFTFSTEFYET